MHDEPEEMPRVTVSMLRRAEQMCRRRLQREHTSRKSRANPASDARFAVSSRIAGDARLAQSETGAPRPEAFVDPTELEPEQRQLYAAAVRGYLGYFGETDGRVVDLGWSTTFPDLGVALVANVGLAVERADDQRELRVLHLGVRARARGAL